MTTAQTTQTQEITLQKARGHGAYGKALVVVTVEAADLFAAQKMVMAALVTKQQGKTVYVLDGLKVGGFGHPAEVPGSGSAVRIPLADLK